MYPDYSYVHILVLRYPESGCCWLLNKSNYFKNKVGNLYLVYTYTIVQEKRLNDSISDHNGVFQSGIFVHFENKVICITHHEPWHGILMSGDKGPRFCKPIYVLVWHIIHWLVLQVAWQILTQRLNIMCYSHFSVKNQLCGS